MQLSGLFHQVWELSTMEQVTTLQGHNGTVYALTWMQSPGGILVFSASRV